MAASHAIAEEERKARLRRQLDVMFGVAPNAPSQPVADLDYPSLPPIYNNFIRSFSPDLYNKAVESRAAAPRETLNAQHSADLTAANAGRSQLEGEKSAITNAARATYTDELGRRFKDSERGHRFQLARQGLLGGSAHADTNQRLTEERNIGATRVDDAVRRSAAELDAARESQRMDALGLINAGAGDEAISAAQSGLRSAFDRVSSARKEDLFSNILGSGLNAAAAGNQQARDEAMLARYRSQLGSFFPNSGGRSSSSGRVTPSQ